MENLVFEGKFGYFPSVPHDALARPKLKTKEGLGHPVFKLNELNETVVETYNFSFLSNNALLTTIIELAAIIKAPHSGRKTIPHLYNTPAANGIAMRL